MRLRYRKKVSIVTLFLLIFVAISRLSEPNKNIQHPSRVSPTPPQVNLEKSTVRVTRVIDGDTIEIEGGVKVRYIGIDTPESVDPRRTVECFGKEAAAKNKMLVEGKDVRLAKDVSEIDRFGRLLRYVYIGDILVNDFLVRNGFALAISYPPDIAHQEEFLQAQTEAREQNRGLWSMCIGTSKPTSLQ